MPTEIITLDNYKFELKLLPEQIDIKITDTILLNIYNGIVKENTISINPITKFYLMIIRSLNKEPNYTIIINDKDSEIDCIISYNTEMVDIEEHIIFTKIDNKEIDRNTELEELITPILGRIPYTNDIITFDLNSTELDFRPYYMPMCEINDNKHYKLNIQLEMLNKFTKVKRIITNDISINGNIADKIFFDENLKLNRYNLNYKLNNIVRLHLMNDDYMLYMPSVVEFVIYIKPFDYIINNYNPTNINDLPSMTINNILNLNLKPFPNLERLIIVNDGYTDIRYIHQGVFNIGSGYIYHNFSNKYDINTNIKLIHNMCKKIKYICLQKISNFMIPNIDEAKSYAQLSNIELEIS